MRKAILLSMVLCLSLSNIFGQALLHKANKYYKNGEFQKAIKAYRQAIKRGENPALAYFNIGNTYYQLDSSAKAIVSYQASIEEAPEFFRARLNLGILYYNLDDMAAAAATLEAASALEPENTQALLILASTYTNLEEYSLAVPILEDILEKEPSSDQCYFLLYEINHIIGDHVEAKQWLEQYPKNGNRVADTYQLLGELAEEEENIEQAVFYYNQLITSAPKRKWTHYQLVRVLHAGGNTLTALQQTETALEKFSDFSDLALLAGNIAFEEKYFRQAEKFYDKAYSLGNAGGLVGLQNLLQHYTMMSDNENAAHINDLIVLVK